MYYISIYFLFFVLFMCDFSNWCKINDDSGIARNFRQGVRDIAYFSRFSAPLS